MGSLEPLTPPATSEGLIAYSGTTTADGDVAGTTVVCSNLTQGVDFWKNSTILILSGACKGQNRDVVSFAAGTLTVSEAFDSQIVAGVRFVILPWAPSTAEVADLLADVGDASGSTLGSLYAILGNPAEDLATRIGYEGATSLADKLTAARAANLDEITPARLSELDAANIPSDIDTLLSRLTNVRAGYLDNLDNANLLNIPDLSALTAARIGYLDNLNNPNLLTIGDLSTLTPARIAYLDSAISSRASQSDILSDATPFAGADIAAIKGYVDELEARLTAARAGYLDNINNAELLNIPDLSALTAARIGYLDNINNAQLLNIPDLSTLTAARISYLDNIDQAGLLQLTAARAGYLDNINNPNLATIGDISSLTPAVIAHLDVDISSRAPVGEYDSVLGNLTGNMDDVTQSETGSIAEYIKYLRKITEGHTETRIGLIVPDLSNIGSDADNLALKAELDLISRCNYIDQTAVDNGEQDWDMYDLIVVGSDATYSFTNNNLDDLIDLKIPIVVCNSAVAEHLKMGTATTQSSSDNTEYCESIGNRVTAEVFGSTGEKVIFDSSQVSDRLDMSDPSLSEEVLMVDTTGDGNTKVVLGWLPMVDASGALNTLDDGTDMPAGRIFAGCFLHAANLTDLGKELLRVLCRSAVGAAVTPSVVIRANASIINHIRNNVGDPNDATTDTIQGKIGTDTEMGDYSLYDLLGGADLKTTDLATRIGYEGATSLADKLTAARAGYLDNLNNAQLLNIPDLSTLTAARIGYLDNINNPNLATIGDISTLTAAKIAYLDAAISSRSSHSAADVWSVATRNLTSQEFPFTNPASALDLSNVRTAAYPLLTDGTYGLSALNDDLGTLLTRLSAARAGYLDNLNGHTPQSGDSYSEVTDATYGLAAIKGYVDELESRLTATRAGYLDELDFDLDARLGTPAGASLAADIATIDGVVDAIRAVTDNLPDGGALNDLATILGLVDTSDVSGTYTYTNVGLEQTVYEDTATTRRQIDLVVSTRNMTQPGTIRIYRKVDGSNYDLWLTKVVDVVEYAPVIHGDERAWSISFRTNQAWKITYEEGGEEGADRDIPYNIITQVLE